MEPVIKKCILNIVKNNGQLLTLWGESMEIRSTEIDF